MATANQRKAAGDMRKLVTGLFVVGFSALSAVQAAAAIIQIRTGVDAALNPLGENVSDPFWQISVNGGGFVSAEVANSEVIAFGMETVAGTARWISDPSVTDGFPFTGWGAGPTAFARRSFDLTGFDLSTTSLSGLWRVADIRLGVYLNGTLIDPQTNDGGAGWAVDQAIAVATGSGLWLPGLNTIELRGLSGNSAYDGFWLDAIITDAAAPPVPEPGSLALLGVGLVGWRARRGATNRP